MRRNERPRMKNRLDNDWFFNNFEHEVKATAKNVDLIWLAMLLLNLLIWAGLVVLGAWAIGHFIL